ncbi:hypothetical protein U737_05145 [Methylomonas sp. LW13]|nr:hypothetical protein U737_05145 [Methylomonas sp. LW13]
MILFQYILKQNTKTNMLQFISNDIKVSTLKMSLFTGLKELYLLSLMPKTEFYGNVLTTRLL